MISQTKQDSKEILSKIEDLKEKLKTPGNVLYDIYQSDSPKKDCILQWGKYLEELHDNGWYDQPVNTISGHIRTELKEMGLTHAIYWAKEVLPFKYKNPYYDHSTAIQANAREVEPPGISSLLKQDCLKVNANSIKRIGQIVEVLNDYRKKLETNLLIEDKIPEDLLMESFIVLDANINHMKQVLDNREKVTPQTQHLLFLAFSNSTLSYTYQTYVKYVKDFKVITPKQIGKIIKGRITNIQKLYDPKTQNEAMDLGFYGTQCDECGSFRMTYQYYHEKRKYMVFCFGCHNWQKATTVIPR